MTLRRICVFCGSSPGAQPAYSIAARDMGGALAARGIELVYGGGHVGLMGAVADACLAGGGKVIGVIPEALAAKELAHHGLTDLRVVASMHERKAMMADLADGFIAMPGGYGTFEEFCEVLTWAQLGLHPKPCGLLNVANYYDPLLKLFDDAVTQRFVRAEHRGLVLQETDPGRLIEMMAIYDVPHLDKWIDRRET